MKKDEWILTKELGRLRKYGYKLQAERVRENISYNIIFEETKRILEPNCTIEEIMSIINVLEKCLEMLIEYNKRKENERTKEETNSMDGNSNSNNYG